MLDRITRDPQSPPFVDQLKTIVDIGEQQLVKNSSKKTGHVLGPDRNAAVHLGPGWNWQALVRIGKMDKAVGHLQAMLEVNPNDNQGLRNGLLGHLLELNGSTKRQR